MTSLVAHARRGFVWPFPSQGFDSFTYGGQTFFGVASTATSPAQEAPPSGFTQLVQGPFQQNAVVFACEHKRVEVFSDIRFYFQGFNKGRPGRLFSIPELDILERPWPNGTTSDLLKNVLLYADIGGNAYVLRDGDRLRVLRPDWVTIVMGDTSGRPVKSAAQLDAEIIGYIYDPKDANADAVALTVDEVMHWAPVPDPLARFRGMSWLTPVVREFQADQAATMHKLAFFENGATPQLVVSLDATVSEEQFKKFVGKMDDAHAGWRNAYKTLYLGQGATPTVVGKDLAQLDFSNTQGKGETRIAAASGIHPVIIPLSEGMQGSSLNAGNYAAARRSTADTTFRPLWRDMCGALEQIVPPPNHAARLWYDDTDVAFLREDVTDLADIRKADAGTIETLVRAGYKPDTVRDAVLANDFSLLEHTGLFSVQLQPPMPDVSAAPAAATNGNAAAPEPVVA